MIARLQVVRRGFLVVRRSVGFESPHFSAHRQRPTRNTESTKTNVCARTRGTGIALKQARVSFYVLPLRSWEFLWHKFLYQVVMSCCADLFHGLFGGFVAPSQSCFGVARTASAPMARAMTFLIPLLMVHCFVIRCITSTLIRSVGAALGFGLGQPLMDVDCACSLESHSIDDEI
jgi:hypothetical protein